MRADIIILLLMVACAQMPSTPETISAEINELNQKLHGGNPSTGLVALGSSNIASGRGNGHALAFYAAAGKVLFIDAQSNDVTSDFRQYWVDSRAANGRKFQGTVLFQFCRAIDRTF